MPGQEPQVGSVVGRGTAWRVRYASDPSVEFNIVSFQIERWNANGEALPPVPAEMGAKSFSGTLTDGDWVELNEQWRPGQVLSPTSITNLTTGVPFAETPYERIGWETQARPLERRVVVLIGLALVVIAVIGVIAGTAIQR